MSRTVRRSSQPRARQPMRTGMARATTMRRPCEMKKMKKAALG